MSSNNSNMTKLWSMISIDVIKELVLNSKKHCQIEMAMGDSHVAGKKYWIISQVVEVITSKSNEIYHEWSEATSDKFHYFYK